MAAMFQFTGGGIGVMPDPADNADTHNVPHHESGTRISLEVLNVGDNGGNANVDVELDGVFNTSWQSSFLNPGEQEVGFVQLGRLSEGEHSVFIYVNPGSGQSDTETNVFGVA